MKLIMGPCAIESRDHARMMCERLLEIVSDRDVEFYYKSSFDKANRSSSASARGVGLEHGADILQELREEYGVATLTDVHETWQCQLLRRSVDVLQIPAFLCRQTDLLLPAAKTGAVINVKKGQFLAPWDTKNIIDKMPGANVWITERGTSFGYNTLIVDYRSLVIMREFAATVIFDATHSVQQPGGLGATSGGQRQFALPLARAAVAVGVDGLFVETHQDPDHAPSDGPNMIPLDQLDEFLDRCLEWTN